MKKIVSLLIALVMVSGLFAFANTASAEEPVKGGTLNIPIPNDPTTLQGWLMRNSTEGIISPAIYETLLAFDAAGVPQPYLCESFVGDAEKLTYTIKMKPGITFHDGTPCDAAAVVWNLDYYKANGAQTGAYFGQYESAEAIDDLTVVVHLNSWNALFNYALTRTTLLCSPTAVEKLGPDGFNELPAGTGAFKVTKWEHGVGIYTEKYENYWQGEPNLDAVNFIIYSSTATQQAALEKGDLDVMNLNGDAVTADALAAKGYNVTLAAIPSTAYTFCFNTQADTPLADVRVRQAICYAIDAETIVNALLQGKYGTFSNQWAVPGSAEYNDAVVGYGYDMAKAQELLKEANYDSNYVLKINYQVGDFMGQLAQICGAQLQAVGIKVDLNAIETANYVNYFGEWEGILFHQMGLQNGQFSQVSANMVAGILFGGKTFTHREDTQELIAAAKTAADNETLVKDLKETVRILFDETVDLYTVAITYNTAVTSPKLHGDYGVVLGNRATWHELWKEN